ncbi:probable E3 ubiquitin-protein ligase HERC3 [Anopheles moucheti]|uniref:probable E3 ubiquitin-protein ligase HERC3 n=1 Tax=Anopheles moucheti TaxID=186751 RepID=UPI0022F03420|nr:probable E3 ubiquitin-protein ligase HERC3 [Anopheles moucheti]
MTAKLWIKGMSPVEAESICGWKEINLCQLLTVNTLASRIQIQFGQIYSFIAHENKLYVFCALMSVRRTISFDANIACLAANNKYCLVLLTTGELKKYECLADQLVAVNFLGIVCDKTKPVDNMQRSITHLACGECVTVACTSDNSVYNIPNHTITLPKHERVRKVVTGFEHCLLLTTNGDVYSWGGGLRGQLGNGEIVAFSEQPRIVEALAGVKVIDIDAEGWHSAAVSSFGDLYTWGWNNQGQLGLQDSQHNERVVSLPQIVSLPGDEEVTVKKVHCGIGHTVVEVTAVDGRQNVFIAGWDLEKRFHYKQASSSATFQGFRKLNGPNNETGEMFGLGTGANQVYFLQRVQNE